jgi:hypothetical protein
MIKSRRMRWTGNVACMVGKRNLYRILVGKPEGKRTIARPRHRWEDNIKMDARETRWNGVAWINLDQNMAQWWALVKMVMNFWVP